MEFLLIVLVIVCFIAWLTTKSSQSMSSKFAQLGDVRGKTLEQVVAAAGLPSSYSALGPGKMLAEWTKAGFHLALSFLYTGSQDSDWSMIDQHRADYVCQGMIHQSGYTSSPTQAEAPQTPMPSDRKSSTRSRYCTYQNAGWERSSPQRPFSLRAFPLLS
jgi:hypothetical protein